MRTCVSPPLLLCWALALSSCASPGTKEPRDPSDSADSETTHDSESPPSTNEAWVFPIDPISSPKPQRVLLAGLEVEDEEAEGHLLSALDSRGQRPIEVRSCADEGETGRFMGQSQRICTLRARADRDDLGSFLVKDWEQDLAGGHDPDNVHAEVTLYHHATVLWELLESPDLGMDNPLRERLSVAGEGDPVPLQFIANYQAPAPEGDTALLPADMAFYVPSEWISKGMGAYLGLGPIRGDVLAFGQGSVADFAYEGETVWHEMGHALTHALAGLGSVHADEYGLCHESAALDEAVANTIAFLTSNESTLGEYLSAHYGPGFTFQADNDAVYPQDLIGLDVSDSLPVLGAAWDLWSQMAAEGASKEQFLRLILLSMEELSSLGGQVRFYQFAEVLLEKAEEAGLDREALRALLDTHGLGEQVRAVDMSAWDKEPRPWLYVGSAADEPWNTVLHWVEEDELLSTAFFQGFIDVPEGVRSLALSATLVENTSSMFAVRDDWDYRLLLRHEEPILFELDGLEVLSLEHDEEITAIVTEDASSATFSLDALEPGERVWLLFVNRGDSDGWLSEIGWETS